MHAEPISLAVDRHERQINFTRRLWSSDARLRLAGPTPMPTQR